MQTEVVTGASRPSPALSRGERKQRRADGARGVGDGEREASDTVIRIRRGSLGLAPPREKSDLALALRRFLLLLRDGRFTIARTRGSGNAPYPATSVADGA